jgi:predicted dithiol-disulfide oxidoreductase (DUF899 family)
VDTVNMARYHEGMTLSAHLDPAPTEPAPTIVDRETWLRERDELLIREKAHTREGDAIAAARRRLPMTEVPPAVLTNASGEVSLLDAFEGREQLVVYRHMWHAGQPIEGQCEGCTLSQWDFKDREDAVYLNEVGVSFAVLAEAPWAEVAPYVEFMGYTTPWYSTFGSADPFWRTDGSIACLLRRGDAVYLTYETTGRGVESIMSTLRLLDLTVYGRQEDWENSPEGWPQASTCHFWRRDGRPTAQWTRPGATAVGEPEHHHH